MDVTPKKEKNSCCRDLDIPLEAGVLLLDLGAGSGAAQFESCASRVHLHF